MNTRNFILLWLVSIVLSAALIIGVILYPDSTKGIEPAEKLIPQAPIVVIGSSLMRSAVHGMKSRDEVGILGDHRAHVRLAVSYIREEQALGLLDRVLTKNRDIVFLESNPFVFDFAYRRSIKTVDPLGLSSFVTSLIKGSHSIASKINIILKRSQNLSLVEEDRYLTLTFQVKPSEIKKYPLNLRPPKYPEILQALVSKAKAQDIQVILIAPPRSQWSAQYIGEIEAKKLELHHQKLAEWLNIPLFQPATFWPNENFQDSAHVNTKGRERFLKELAAWWKTQQ